MWIITFKKTTPNVSTLLSKLNITIISQENLYDDVDFYQCFMFSELHCLYLYISFCVGLVIYDLLQHTNSGLMLCSSLPNWYTRHGIDSRRAKHSSNQIRKLENQFVNKHAKYAHNTETINIWDLNMKYMFLPNQSWLILVSFCPWHWQLMSHPLGDGKLI